MNSILFVCLGNICRSPLAEGIAKQLSSLHDLKLTIDSAGTGSWHIGESPCEHSITVANKHGIDISGQKGRQVSVYDFDQYDLIVALDGSNYNDLKRLGCENLTKLGNYGFEGNDVPDPYFFDGFEGFEKVFTMIEVAVENLFKAKKLL
ncbi:MAG: low molecular weight phosphotyrosine protein phosphatase [Thiovulaceae bacterium]|nr:low molecular weight phosphotyrosine protein phosphatase [Sulfurimonadaceae bacterium]